MSVESPKRSCLARQARSTGARVEFSAGEPKVIDGPFAETQELIVGYWIWQVSSLDEALDWVRRAPFAPGDVIEVRQVFEADDFGEAFTPELREQEERLRKQAEANQ